MRQLQLEKFKSPSRLCFRAGRAYFYMLRMWLHFQQELKISCDLRLFLQVTGINTLLPEKTAEKTFSVQRNPMSEDAQLCMKVPKICQGVLRIGVGGAVG